jgi:hypothetical protein
MGEAIENRLGGEFAEVASFYGDYLLCRQTQFFVFRKPTGKADGSERLVTVVWPTGFSSWPSDGGLNDQGYLTVRLFSAFLRGEQRGQIRLMQRNR